MYVHSRMVTASTYQPVQEATICLAPRLRGGCGAPEELSVAPGGLIRQCILEDNYPATIWERERIICFNVQILNSTLFRQVTGIEPPETSISAATYAARNLPYFKIYNETSSIKGDFQGVKSVKEIDKAKAQEWNLGMPGEDEEPEYPQPPTRNPVILLNPQGIHMAFRPVSELKEELRRMNAVQF